MERLIVTRNDECAVHLSHGGTPLPLGRQQAKPTPGGSIITLLPSPPPPAVVGQGQEHGVHAVVVAAGDHDADLRES